MQVFKQGRHQQMVVDPHLEELLGQMFSIIPNLEFSSLNSRATVNGDVICEVEVFSGEQKLGKVGYVRIFIKNEYDYVYQIYSRKITKVRGDRFIKRTQSLKSALRTAKEVFVKDEPRNRVGKICKKFQSAFNDIVWRAGSTYKDLQSPYYVKTFQYVLDVVDGANPTIDPQILQVINSDAFKQARDNYRIVKSVQKTLEKTSGAFVYVDRENKITLADLDTGEIIKTESTYDLPKNYQEKYTILKIMELNQPIEGVGIKMTIEVDDQKMECYYLKPGDTPVTH